MLKTSQEQEKNLFLNFFVQFSGRIWTVIGKGYFSHDRSHSRNVASAHRVMVLPFKWNLFKQNFCIVYCFFLWFYKKK